MPSLLSAFGTRTFTPTRSAIAGGTILLLAGFSAAIAVVPCSAQITQATAANNPPVAIASDAPSASLPNAPSAILFGDDQSSSQTTPAQTNPPATQPGCDGCAVDANGNPIPLDRQQPHRILGFMPNFRSVSAGAAVHPLSWKYNFTIATHQATDYSTFIFLGLTSLVAEGENEHPVFGKGVDGFYSYAWRGFLDKTDGTYLSAWLLPSLLHEDTRFYPLGSGHSVIHRELYIISRQAVAKTYSGHDTPNIAGLGGKALTQYISRFYYPPSAADFGVLAEKFGYSVMRDVMFSNIREFYPDIAAHYIKKHREKAARQAALDAQAAHVKPAPAPSLAH